MFNFLLDKTSYYIGIAAGFFAWWLFQQAGPIIKILRQMIDEQVQSIKQGMSTTIEQRYRQDIVKLLQGNHIAYRLFSLKEVTITPQLMAPPTPVIPEGTIPPDDITQIAVPYMPDWAGVAAAFEAKTFSIAEGMSRGANLLIFGKPGSGRTFALSHFASQIAQRHPNVGELGSLLPVTAHAGNLDLSGKKGKPLDVFYTALKNSVSSAVEPQLANLLKTAFSSKFALVIIDGFDEISPDDQSILIKFIKSIQTKYPGNRYVISTSTETITCHETLGLHPIPIAAWSNTQKQKFVERWGKLWQKYILKQSWAKKVPKSINPIFYNGWLNNGSNTHSPLHLTLRTWALYAGDMLGSTEINDLEAYIRRMTRSVVNAQPALEQLAVQTTHSQQPIIALKSAGNFVSDYESESSSQTDIEPEPSFQADLQEIDFDDLGGESIEESQESSSSLSDDDFDSLLDDLDDLELPEEIEEPKKSSKKKDKPIKKRQVHRLLPELVKTDLLIYRPNSKIGFANPVVNGYLAAKGFADRGDAQQLSSQPNWSGKSLAIDYLAANNEIEPLIGNLLEKDKTDPMKRGLLSMGNWPRYAPKVATWRSPILRVMADSLQQESLPLSLRSKIMAALAFSGETQMGTLFRQMLKSEKHSCRWLGALGCGLIRDKKSVNDLGLLLIYDNSVFINRAASLALIVIDTNQSLELVTRALLEGNEEVRRAAAEGLARHPTEGFPVLRDGAAVEDILVRRAVVFGLVRVNEPWAIELLEKMQLEDDQWVIRNAATQGLEDVKSISVSIPAPQPEIHETPWLLKFASEKGMGVSPGQAGWDMLKAALTGGNEDQKLAAMDIYRLKPSEARNVIPELYKLMSGPEGDVREAAYTTLWYLSAAGVNLPTS